MKSWNFMTCFNILIPLIMTLFGFYFKNNAPKKINNFLGYRTAMSMKNMDTWTFAHHYIGRLWSAAGVIMMLISVIISVAVISQNEHTVGVTSAVLCTVQTVGVIVSIFPAERALRKNFDKNGNRIKY